MAFRCTSAALAKNLSSSSRSWLARQKRDPYVKSRVQYRSRAAHKLLELDSQWGRFLSKPDVQAVVDLGAAPGGWSQVVAERLGWITRDDTTWNADSGRDPIDELDDDPEQLDTSIQATTGRGVIAAVDILDMRPIPGVSIVHGDFLHPSTIQKLRNVLKNESNPSGKADVVLSDIAVNASGNKTRDIARSIEVCQAVYTFASENLRTASEIGRKKGGVLLMKHFMHPLAQEFRTEFLDPNFVEVHFIKPDSSRSESSEGYWLCQGWRGLKTWTRSDQP